jgi:hypothetical protein
VRRGTAVRRIDRWLAVVAATAVTVALSTGIARAAGTPAVSLSPASLDFGTQQTGTTSAPQTITATNTGTANVFFNNVSLTGDSLDFTIADDECIGASLPIGGTCTVSVTFSPTTTGTRTANVVYTDNAPDTPQSAPLTGTGVGTTAQLAIDTEFLTCTNGVCDIGEGSNVFVKNFFSTSFLATGGMPPYTWSGRLPPRLRLRPSGLVVGAPTELGTSIFRVTVRDAAGSKVSGAFSLTVTDPPPPTPPGCQTGGVLHEPLIGHAINGVRPSGLARADETEFSGCGGFSLLSVGVANVNLPDGTLLWVTLDFEPVGIIKLTGGSGTMATYNLGDFGVSRDRIGVFNSLPDQPQFAQILIGLAFS